MTPSALRARLNVESLERRDTPSTFDWSVDLDGVFQVWDTPASITQSNGSVIATGTQSDDIIRVDNYTPVLSPYAFSFNDDIGVFGDQIVVTITDAQGNIRTDASGNQLRFFYNAGSVNTVEARGLGGNDQTFNTTNAIVIHVGAEGNDSLHGGSNMDILNGGAGDDSLTGGGGNDQLYGGPGKDRSYGDAGNDLIQSGSENDTNYGGPGDDRIDGEEGDDTFFGGDGNDTMNGGDGGDLMLGEGGNDLMHGDAGNDILSGGNGNDALFGDAGNDDLEGFAGNDALFGGTGHEYLLGGGGYDRFLKWDAPGNKTTIVDAKSHDSVSVFKNTTSTTTFSVQGHTLRYNPAAWSEDEIELADGGLAFMHQETGNVKLLKRKDGSNMTFYRFGNYIAYNETDGKNDANDMKANALGVSFSGFNKGDGRIYFNDGTFNNSPHDVAATVIHELAHNWDNENPRYNEWKSLSGWVNTSKVGAGQTLSKDGKWVYNSNAEFARDYGKTNPFEDFSTSFEAYFDLHTGQLSYSELVRQAAKLNFIGLFITQMSG